MKKSESVKKETAEKVTEAFATGVYRQPDGLWVARVYAIDSKGNSKISKESIPDLRAIAIERMQIYASNLFMS